ncbi:MAG: hypothetical protein K6D03_08320 [Solobacterium sp.]|nr:hypothetical protein [Solobacterium sp.]
MKKLRLITVPAAAVMMMLAGCAAAEKPEESGYVPQLYEEAEKELCGETWIINPEKNRSPQDMERRKEEMVYFSLSQPEDISPEDAEKAAGTILNRLSLFSGGSEFFISLYDDTAGTAVHQDGNVPEKIDVWYDASLFKNEDASKLVRYRISRPMNLFLYEYSDGSVINNGIPLSRDAIAEIKAGSGSSQGIDASDFGTSEDRLCWLKITLTTEFTSANSDFLEACGNRLILLQDVDTGGSFAGMHLVRASGNEWYAVFEDDDTPADQQLILYNYTHAPTASAYYVSDTREPADWLAPEKDSTHLQTVHSDIAGDRVRLYITAGDQNPNDEEWQDMIGKLRTRLDLIGIPYSIGTSVLSDRALYIDTPFSSRSGLPVFQLLCTGGDMFLAATTQSWLKFDEPGKVRTEIVTDGDTIAGLRIDISDNGILKLFNESSDGLRLGGQVIFLTDYKCMYFESALEGPVRDGKLFMTLCPERSGIGNSYKNDGWFYELTAEVIENPLTFTPEWSYGIYSESGDNITDTDRFNVR